MDRSLGSYIKQTSNACKCAIMLVLPESVSANQTVRSICISKSSNCANTELMGAAVNMAMSTQGELENSICDNPRAAAHANHDCKSTKRSDRPHCLHMNSLTLAMPYNLLDGALPGSCRNQNKRMLQPKLAKLKHPVNNLPPKKDRV